MARKNGRLMYSNYSLIIYNKNDLYYLVNLPSVDKYAYIFHDKDVFVKDGDEHEKKPHYHLYLRFLSRRRLGWIENEKLVHTFEENIFCERARDVNQLLQYFLHRDKPDKYQYDVNEIVANYNYLDINENDKDDNSQILEGIQLIVEGKLTWTKFFQQFPSMIFSSANLKRVHDLLWAEYYGLSFDKKV